MYCKVARLVINCVIHVLTMVMRSRTAAALVFGATTGIWVSLLGWARVLTTWVRTSRSLACIKQPWVQPRSPVSVSQSSEHANNNQTHQPLHLHLHRHLVVVNLLLY